MRTVTVSEAKPKLGHLVDLALREKEAIFIRRGDRVVQLVPAVLPEPIPAWPEGALSRTAAEIAFLQSGDADEAEPFVR
jgi:hypothetical protein